EGGALVGPALVGFLDLERRGKRLERPRAAQRADRAGRQLALVRLRVPGDVFAEAFLSAAREADERRDPGEIARHGGLEPFEPVALDLEWKRGDPRVGLGRRAH